MYCDQIDILSETVNNYFLMAHFEFTANLLLSLKPIVISVGLDSPSKKKVDCCGEPCVTIFCHSQYSKTKTAFSNFMRHSS